MLSEFKNALAALISGKKPVYLSVRVIPKSPQNAITEILADGSWKIRVRGAAEKGRANDELIRFLSEVLAIEQSQIVIISGKSDRHKLIKINPHG